MVMNTRGKRGKRGVVTPTMNESQLADSVQTHNRRALKGVAKQRHKDAQALSSSLSVSRKVSKVVLQDIESIEEKENIESLQRARAERHQNSSRFDPNTRDGLASESTGEQIQQPARHDNMLQGSIDHGEDGDELRQITESESPKLRVSQTQVKQPTKNDKRREFLAKVKKNHSTVSSSEEEEIEDGSSGLSDSEDASRSNSSGRHQENRLELTPFSSDDERYDRYSKKTSHSKKKMTRPLGITCTTERGGDNHDYALSDSENESYDRYSKNTDYSKKKVRSLETALKKARLKFASKAMIEKHNFSGPPFHKGPFYGAWLVLRVEPKWNPGAYSSCESSDESSSEPEEPGKRKSISTRDPTTTIGVKKSKILHNLNHVTKKRVIGNTDNCDTDKAFQLQEKVLDEWKTREKSVAELRRIDKQWKEVEIAKKTFHSYMESVAQLKKMEDTIDGIKPMLEEAMEKLRSAQKYYFAISERQLKSMQVQQESDNDSSN